MGNDESLVRAAWRSLVPAPQAADAEFDELLRRYREPHRRYHTLTHVSAVLGHAQTLIDAARVRSGSDTAPEPDATAIRWAVLYHDAVYDPRSSSNEADSAALCRGVMERVGVSADQVDHVVDLIMATAHVLDRSPANVDTRRPGIDVDRDIVLDADLAVLAARPAVYQSYCDGVRSEYGHLDEATWRQGRSRVLVALLEREPLYRTATMTASAARARANMRAELAGLRPMSPPDPAGD